MALFTTLAATATAYAFSQRKQAPLVEKLVDQPSTPKLTRPQTLLDEAGQLFHDLFSDTRQQYQQALSTHYDVEAQQRTEQTEKRNLMHDCCHRIWLCYGSYLYLSPALFAQHRLHSVCDPTVHAGRLSLPLFRASV